MMEQWRWLEGDKIDAGDGGGRSGVASTEGGGNGLPGTGEGSNVYDVHSLESSLNRTMPWMSVLSLVKAARQPVANKIGVALAWFASCLPSCFFAAATTALR
ncbi:hypothetical protein E2562_034686 [Oryza meyeriana var. granulata]|uniref:Uncharacterized protein n=1 Tax=Oryza meyeriana var. granulata TaxID=110450 RepID=A0A6G1C0Z9_9ORYZ|nr:hypothetical protein E2562_034686 [Oryza meyeriana var. granulata]